MATKEEIGRDDLRLAIRPLARRDLDRLAALHAACFEEGWSRETLADLLASAGAFGFAGFLAGKAVGFILCQAAAGEGEILSLGVLGAFRGRGVARELLAAGVERARAGGIAALFLEVAEDNLAARRLYESAGFELVARRADYYRHPGGRSAAALVLRSVLEP